MTTGFGEAQLSAYYGFIHSQPGADDLRPALPAIPKVLGRDFRKMQDRQLYEQILGIRSPWYVERVELQMEKGPEHLVKDAVLRLFEDESVFASALCAMECWCAGSSSWPRLKVVHA